MNTSKRKHPLVTIIHELLLLQGIKVTYNSVMDKLLQHPLFPSLFSITNTLENLGLENKAVKIEKDKLLQLEVPFLVLIQNQQTVLVKSVKEGNITYLNPLKGWLTTSIGEFEKLCENMAVLVDTTAKFSEKDYPKKRSLESLYKLRLPVSLSLIVTLIISVLFGLDDIFQKLVLITNLMGLIISFLLVKREVKHTHYSFCKWRSNIDCDEVLNSKAAKILRWLSFSDIGLLYFSGNILVLLVISLQPENLGLSLFNLMSLLFFLALPYTFYSILYQGFVIKKWCVLCLGVMIVLWLNAILGYFYMLQTEFHFDIEKTSFFVLCSCLLVPASIWMYLKGILKKNFAYEPLYYSALRMINDSQIFRLVLQKKESTSLDLQENEIILGNTKSRNTLTIVINPYCPACGREYDHILELLEKHPDFTRVILRFAGSIQYLDEYKLEASTILIDRYLHNKSNYKKVLKDWFEIRNVEDFLKKYPTKHSKLTELMLIGHYKWAEKANVSITPTYYFNGKKMNPEITIKNLSNMLDVNP